MTSSSSETSSDPESGRERSSAYGAHVLDGTAELLTAPEVAALLRVTSSWVYAETRRNRIPHLRLGRRVRYRREALEAWMREIESYAPSPIRVSPRNR